MSSKLPIYKQVKFKIKDKIDDGEYLPGQSISSERELAKKFGVNRNTIKKAIQSLIDDGLLYSIPSSGTFVCNDEKNFMLGIFDNKTYSSISSRLKNFGEQSVSRIINTNSFNNSISIAEKLNIGSSEEIYSIYRQRLGANDEIIALEQFFTPKKYFDDIQNYDFSRVSLYDYMDKKNMKPVSFKRKLSIIQAPNQIAKLLNVKTGHYVYYFEFHGYTTDNVAIEYTKCFIDSSKIKFEYTISNE